MAEPWRRPVCDSRGARSNTAWKKERGPWSVGVLMIVVNNAREITPDSLRCSLEVAEAMEEGEPTMVAFRRPDEGAGGRKGEVF